MSNNFIRISFRLSVSVLSLLLSVLPVRRSPFRVNEFLSLPVRFSPLLPSLAVLRIPEVDEVPCFESLLPLLLLPKRLWSTFPSLRVCFKFTDNSLSLTFERKSLLFAVSSIILRIEQTLSGRANVSVLQALSGRVMLFDQVESLRALQGRRVGVLLLSRGSILNTWFSLASHITTLRTVIMLPLDRPLASVRMEFGRLHCDRGLPDRGLPPFPKSSRRAEGGRSLSTAGKPRASSSKSSRRSGMDSIHVLHIPDG